MADLRKEQEREELHKAIWKIADDLRKTQVKAEKILGVIDYDYPTFHLTMHCILCTIVFGNLQLIEHEASRWLTKENLRTVNWLPADLLILDKIEELL